MNWISVKDKLPENGEDLIVFDSNKCTHFSNFWHNKFEDLGNSICISFEIEDVTHWIYLKDIPKPDTIQTRYCFRCNYRSLTAVDRSTCFFIDYFGCYVWLCQDCIEIFHNARFVSREKWFKDNMCAEWNEGISKP